MIMIISNINLITCDGVQVSYTNTIKYICIVNTLTCLAGMYVTLPLHIFPPVIGGCFNVGTKVRSGYAVVSHEL